MARYWALSGLSQQTAWAWQKLGSAQRVAAGRGDPWSGRSLDPASWHGSRFRLKTERAT
jgi:hypothetical protein